MTYTVIPSSIDHDWVEDAARCMYERARERHRRGDIYQFDIPDYEALLILEKSTHIEHDESCYNDYCS